ncbi:MAG: periplasmic heavy metal sensor [Phycisphaerales bacterium]|jgi:Spy/CpxP family protein refolding chaperone
MWKNMKTAILIFSVALNTMFGTMWAIHRLPAHFGCAGHKGDSSAETCVSCPLHRELGTSEKQWQQIEPCLVEFKRSAQEVCRKNKQLRGELIDLIAAPQTGYDAIRAKQDEILAGQRKMQELLVSHLLTEKEMLTPQQQKILFNMIRKQCGCAGGSVLSGVNPFDVQEVGLNHAGNGNHSERI